MNTSRALVSVLLIALAATACKKSPPPESPAPPELPAAKPPEPPPAPVAAEPAAAEPVRADAAMAEPAPAATNPKLMAPPKLTEKAPKTFKVKFTTSVGDFTVQAHRDWAPNGVDRFYNLAKNGFFDDVRFFRAIKGFMVQFGIHGDPAVSAKWRDANIPDDPVKESNKRGYLTFAMAGPNTRSTQFFINFGDNANLDGMGFPPIGKVVEGLDVIDKINTEYGEAAPSGRGPDQGRLQMEGNVYLKRDFARLDFVKSAKIVK